MRKSFLLLLLTLLFSSAMLAQKKTFMRFFSPSGKKFAKGFYGGTTDSSIVIYKSSTGTLQVLYKNKNRVEIPLSSIGVIKTKRSNGNAALIGYAIGGGTLGILGMVTEPKPQPGSFSLGPEGGFIIGQFVGGIAGTVAGLGIRGLKKGYTFRINGSNTLWREQRNMIENLPVIQPAKL